MSLDLESVPCPLCASRETRPLYGKDGWVLGRCRGCGLVRQDPRPTAAALLDDHYDGWVQDKEDVLARPQAYEGLAPWQPAPLAAFEASVRYVDRHRRRQGEKGTWVDVGASTGSLLVAARAAGWQVTGVEPGRTQAEICIQEHGIEVVHGLLADAAFPEHFAEVVSYRHVLEHVHDVRAELVLARRVLAPDGVLLVEVPNLGGLRYLWGRLRAATRLNSPFWARLNLPEHLYYFTEATLEKLLLGSGFEAHWTTTYGRVRQTRNPLRAVYEPVRDALCLGNNLRVVAVPS